MNNVKLSEVDYVKIQDITVEIAEDCTCDEYTTRDLCPYDLAVFNERAGCRCCLSCRDKCRLEIGGG